MKRVGLLLLAVLPAACATAPLDRDASGYRGIEEVRILAKGME